MLVLRNTSAYGFGATAPVPFDVALERTKEAFAVEGFCVVSEIDMRDRMCDTLGVSIPPYTILGLCNPNFALRALREETEAGLLMPCNVLVRADGPCTQVSVMNPYHLIRLTENNRLRGLSDEMFAALERGLERFAATPETKLVAA
jgi:uncharacterized protein (DUF302 family)